MADLLRKNVAFQVIFGPAGQQLVTDVSGVIPKLPTPEFEFAIIAGGAANGGGYNPLIAGDDDLLVSVESARLPGATDYLLIRALHTGLPWNKEVIDATLRFLQTGHLRKDGSREPIPREKQESKAEAVPAKSGG